MKKVFTISILFLALTACEKNQILTESDEAKLAQTNFRGAIFEDWESFYEYDIFMEKLKDESSVLYELRDENYVSFLASVLNSEDEDKLKVADQLTIGMMGIFNEDLQFMVGDKIISFNEGAYVESDINSNSFQPIDNIETSTMVLDNKNKEPNLEATLYVGDSDTAGYSQLNFNMYQYRRCSDNVSIFGPGSKTMRYTQQLKSHRAGSTQFLFIETKLYWINSNGIPRVATGEERKYTYTLSGTVAVPVAPFGILTYVPLNVPIPVNCTRDKYNQQDISGGGVFPVNPGSPWNVNITGTITHYINGDASYNKWFAPVNWN